MSGISSSLTNVGFSVLFLVTTFYSWLALNKHKKAWETVFQRSLNTIFFAFEELLKNDILLSDGMMRLALDWGTKRTCARVHSVRKNTYSKTSLLQTGMWWRNLVLNG